jgi:N,N'-diacetyllegionaminate synthase
MATAESITLGTRRIGRGSPCFILAEAGVNHNGQIDLAHALIEAVAKAGADAIKFQTFKAESLATASAPKANYQQGRTPANQSQVEMLKSLELPNEVYPELKQHAEEVGLIFLSTPFDEASADFLEQLGVPGFKIPSGELTNLPFIAHLSRKGKPLIISTGMSTLAEVEAAVNTVERFAAPLCLLHCVSCYPAAPEDTNLLAMATLSQAFQLPVGYSDHTLGNAVPLASVALGAVLLEKHVTLDRKMDGPDHAASSEPEEFATLVRDIRIIESAMGNGRKRPMPNELNTAQVARRSIVAARDIPKGSIVCESDLMFRRPGTGLPPNLHGLLLGRIAKIDIVAGTLISLEMVS